MTDKQRLGLLIIVVPIYALAFYNKSDAVSIVGLIFWFVGALLFVGIKENK